MSDQKASNKLDRTAFEDLFKSHFVYLCNFAFQYVADMDTAKDITQKIFVNLWENRDKIKPEQSIKSYLFTSVKNRCLNHIRDHKKYRSRILDIDIHDLDLACENDHLAVEELQHKIDKALLQLPEKCREVFKLSRYQDKKYKEIAEILDISVKTVEAHMSRALRSLRADLQDYLPLIMLLIEIFL